MFAMELDPSGTCIIHHMFGAVVFNTVHQLCYGNYCFITACRKMFAMAMEKLLSDQGAVASTLDILNFVSLKVQQAVSTLFMWSAPASSTFTSWPKCLQFIIGTNEGMITYIVQSVQNIFATAANPLVGLESISHMAQPRCSAGHGSCRSAHCHLSLAWQVVADGCNTAGGCATFPFMKLIAWTPCWKS